MHQIEAIPMYQELFENYSAEKLSKFEGLKDTENRSIRYLKKNIL